MDQLAFQLYFSNLCDNWYDSSYVPYKNFKKTYKLLKIQKII